MIDNIIEDFSKKNNIVCNRLYSSVQNNQNLFIIVDSTPSEQVEKLLNKLTIQLKTTDNAIVSIEYIYSPNTYRHNRYRNAD